MITYKMKAKGEAFQVDGWLCIDNTLVIKADMVELLNLDPKPTKSAWKKPEGVLWTYSSTEIDLQHRADLDRLRVYNMYELLAHSDEIRCLTIGKIVGKKHLEILGDAPDNFRLSKEYRPFLVGRELRMVDPCKPLLILDKGLPVGMVAPMILA